MRWPVLLSTLLLSACQALVVTDINSPYYQIPVGSKLILQTELKLAPRQVSFYIQNGAVVKYFSLDQYHAHCKFEMWSKVDEKRRVKPTEFEITRVSHDYEFVRHFNRPVRVAALGIAGDTTPIAVIDKTFLYLKSESERDVYRITCEHWSDTSDSRPLTVKEIRKTLDGMFELQIREMK